MNCTNTVAALTEHLNVDSGISGSVTFGAIGVFRDATLKNQSPLASTDAAGLIFAALTGSETRAANHDKGRRTTNHVLFKSAINLKTLAKSGISGIISNQHSPKREREQYAGPLGVPRLQMEL